MALSYWQIFKLFLQIRRVLKMSKMLGNWQTTLFGVLAGVLNYFVSLGPNLPTTPAEWGMALLSALMVALGIAAKDAKTGSAPGATQ